MSSSLDFLIGCMILRNIIYPSELPYAHQLIGNNKNNLTGSKEDNIYEKLYQKMQIKYNNYY